MRTRVLGVIAVIGLGASLASLIDYLGPSPMFCAETGCAIVRASAWSHPLGIPMPLVGVAYFAAMLVLRRARLGLAIAGGVAAAGLIALQAFVIHAWCKLCMIADPAAIGCAIAVAMGAKPVLVTWRRGAVAIPAVGAIVLALGLWTHTAAPAIPIGAPACVAREQAPGAVTVVEFVDFECPFCRALQQQLVAAISHAASPVRVVRKMVPLPQHEHALPAALAWCCADAQGRGDAMAAALFAADPAELTPDGCERIAAHIGCDLDRYRRDYPATFGHVAADMLDARAAGIRSLPTLFINTRQLVGADHTTADLIAALDHAAR